MAQTYLHAGLVNGLGATPGVRYSVLVTNVKLEGNVDGWLATKQVAKFDGGNARLFVQEDGSVAYFAADTVLR
mgnify:CR=1 FL=1